jgi:hypothetical protein
MFLESHFNVYIIIMYFIDMFVVMLIFPFMLCMFVLMRVDEQVTEDPSTQQIEIVKQELVEGKLCP